MVFSGAEYFVFYIVESRKALRQINAANDTHHWINKAGLK